MATPLFSSTFAMGDLRQLRTAYSQLPPALAKKHLRSALKKAIAPFLPEFRAVAPRRTGGLSKSPITVADFDRVSGNWTARVGYGMSKKKTGYHALLVNNGTKERKTKKGKSTGKGPALHFADSMLASVRSRGLSNLETHLYAALDKATNELPRYLAMRKR